MATNILDAFLPICYKGADTTLFMKDQLYVYDCLTGKLRVSNGDFMAVGAGKQNTFRVRSAVENAGVFAQRNGTCRFFPHNKVTSYSINGNRTSDIAHIKPEQFYLFVLCGGCFIAWFGNDDSRPDFGSFNTDCWYTYHPEREEWSQEITFESLIDQAEKTDDCVLATFHGLGYNAFRITDIREVSTFLRNDDGTAHVKASAKKEQQTTFFCPHCNEPFIPKNVLAVAVHPQLQGDSILGPHAMKRFVPTQYTQSGLVLDEMGAECNDFACTQCHLKLPPFYENTVHHRIAIVGAPAAGKAYYLASLVHQLERELPQHFGIPFRDADPEQNAALNNMRMRAFYSNTPEEFREGREFLSTKLRSRVWRHNEWTQLPHPFIYTLNKGNASHSLIFYSGCPDDDESHTQNVPKFDKDALRHVDAIFYVFDPCQHPAFREIIEDLSTSASDLSPRILRQQSILLTDIELHLRKSLGLPHGTKVNTPIAFILTKSDLWQSLLGPEPLLSTVRSGRLKMNNIQSNSLRIRELLFRIAPEICSHAEAISGNLNYFAVSSFGIQPQIFMDELTGETFTAPAGGKLVPSYVSAPLMWILSQYDSALFSDA